MTIAEKLQELLSTPITDADLMRVCVERRAVEHLAAELKKASDVLARHEAEVAARLKSGAPVVARDFSAELTSEPGDCRPPWKQIYLAHVQSEGVDPKFAEALARAEHPAKDRVILVVEPKTKMRSIP